MTDGSEPGTDPRPAAVAFITTEHFTLQGARASSPDIAVASPSSGRSRGARARERAGTWGRAEGEVLPCEPKRSPGIAADSEPELGGMVGERLRVTGEQLVVAGFRVVTPGLRLVGPAGVAQDASELRRVVRVVGGERQRPQAGDRRRRLPQGGLDLGQVALRGDVAAGYDVAMSGSGSAKRIALTVDVLAPGARAVETGEVVRHADLIVLAVPTHRFRELPRDLFAGKTLIDAMNYWEPIDGVDEELATAPNGTSVAVQERFRSARVVKGLNQLGYHEFEEGRRPRGAAGRVALTAAGDDRAAVAAVIQLIDRLGFDAVDAGPLEAGRALEPDGPAFGISYSAD